MTGPAPARRSGRGDDRAGLVDVVVVTHRSAEHLAGALSPLVGQPLVASITVVDNASTDDSVAVARGLGVDVVANPRNAGFGAGADQGLRRGRAPFALLLNPDATISSDDLALLVDAAGADDRLAALAPRVVHPDGAEQRVALVLGQPLLQVEVVELLAPQHPGERLAMDAALVFGQRRRRDARVELVRVRQAIGKRLVEVREGRGKIRGGQPKPDRPLPLRRHVEHVVTGRFRPDAIRID